MDSLWYNIVLVKTKSTFSWSIKHTVMRACAIPHWFVHNDRDSADYILITTAQSEAAKVAEETQTNNS